MFTIRLREAQWQLALANNATMLIWLGKQWLGQTDEGPRRARRRAGSLTAGEQARLIVAQRPLIIGGQSFSAKTPPVCRIACITARKGGRPRPICVPLNIRRLTQKAL